MNKDEVQRLAKLARIGIDDAEAEKLSHEFENILGYVSEVKQAVASEHVELTKEDLSHRNVMRTDTEPHESELYTEELLAEAPAEQDGYIVVKKIL